MAIPHDPTPAPHPSRRRWEPPMVEALGTLDLLTLQQSVPVGPGGFLPDAERTSRLA